MAKKKPNWNIPAVEVCGFVSLSSFRGLPRPRLRSPFGGFVTGIVKLSTFTINCSAIWLAMWDSLERMNDWKKGLEKKWKLIQRIVLKCICSTYLTKVVGLRRQCYSVWISQKENESSVSFLSPPDKPFYYIGSFDYFQERSHGFMSLVIACFVLLCRIEMTKWLFTTWTCYLAEWLVRVSFNWLWMLFADAVCSALSLVVIESYFNHWSIGKHIKRADQHMRTLSWVRVLGDNLLYKMSSIK